MVGLDEVKVSRPARGAWIEICVPPFVALSSASRPARGAWIEIHVKREGEICICGRAPQGARGLKSAKSDVLGGTITSRPARGAWIEIAANVQALIIKMSRPARGAWIEISVPTSACKCSGVAPRKGRVD